MFRQRFAGGSGGVAVLTIPDAGNWLHAPLKTRFPVGAAARCDLLILLFKIKIKDRSLFHSTAPTGYGQKQLGFATAPIKLFMPAVLLIESVMKFAIALFPPPMRPPRAEHAVCAGCTGGGHEIVRPVFLSDGVYNASDAVVTPQDELDLPKQWRAFITSNNWMRGVHRRRPAPRVLNAEEAQRYQRDAVSVSAPWDCLCLGQLHDACKTPTA